MNSSPNGFAFVQPAAFLLLLVSALAGMRILRPHERSIHLIEVVDGLGLNWLGLNWLGVNWLGLNWLGLNWLGVNWLGVNWLGVNWRLVVGCP